MQGVNHCIPVPRVRSFPSRQGAVSSPCGLRAAPIPLDPPSTKRLTCGGSLVESGVKGGTGSRSRERSEGIG